MTAAHVIIIVGVPIFAWLAAGWLRGIWLHSRSAARARSRSALAVYALDEIAELLRDPEWGVGMLEDIAVVVSATGRSLETPPARRWDRH